MLLSYLLNNTQLTKSSNIIIVIQLNNLIKTCSRLRKTSLPVSEDMKMVYL